ncbi:hypothetical protein KIW84_025265 [Lathyrus oleraceus]|uniref:Uncharacterized protein n=1 Tax=Pisum sativum TaxID=3888 RepID=A0A9D4YHS7_PEA|nr:hypothetical protein KIW84_025265 [Pisum sativum]
MEKLFQYINEEVVDNADVNRFIKEKVMDVEKCVAKKKHVGKKKFVGKVMDKKDFKGFITFSAGQLISMQHFPRTIAKTCLRLNQTENKVIDVEETKIFKCRVHTAKRKNESSAYEKCMSLGWYKFAKSKNLCDGDTLVQSMLRFSPYVYVKLQRS